MQSVNCSASRVMPVFSLSNMLACSRSERYCLAMSSTSDSPNRQWTLFFAAWLVALIATLGSLFFSEVMKYVPCTLCWYQRIFMYPLVAILLVGIFPLDTKVVRYSTPLAGLGWITATYHVLVQLKIIPETASPCVMGVPCSAKYIQWFGVITIPVLSWIAFTLIGCLLFMGAKRN